MHVCMYVCTYVCIYTYITDTLTCLCTKRGEHDGPNLMGAGRAWRLFDITITMSTIAVNFFYCSRYLYCYHSLYYGAGTIDS